MAKRIKKAVPAVGASGVSLNNGYAMPPEGRDIFEVIRFSGYDSALSALLEAVRARGRRPNIVGVEYLDGSMLKCLVIVEPKRY